MAKKIKFFNKEFKDMTDKQLIDDVQGLNQSIDVVECFGVKDLVLRGMIENELGKRGYDSQNNIEYYKRDED